MSGEASPFRFDSILKYIESTLVIELILLIFLLRPKDLIPLNLVMHDWIGKLCWDPSLTTSLLQFNFDKEHLNSADEKGRMSGIVFTDIFSSIIELFAEDMNDGWSYTYTGYSLF